MTDGTKNANANPTPPQTNLDPAAAPGAAPAPSATGEAGSTSQDQGLTLSDQSLAAQALAAAQGVTPRGPDRRKSAVDRRTGMDRRQMSREESGYTGPERRSGIDRRLATGLERRRGPGRRRSDERKSAEEGEMTAEQFEFIQAVQTYKKVNKKLYPTWTEVLEVVRQLGYRKVLPREIRLEGVPEPKVYNQKDLAA
jgi:hypothetical protein